VDGNLAVSADVNFGSNLTVTENVTAHGFTSTSDARFKDHITSLSGALDKVMALRGVTYDWKQKEFPERRFDSAKHVGFIAQEMETVLPELVSKDKDGYRSVNYMGAIPVLVEAIKEQQKAITAQQKEIDALKKEKGKDKGYFASGLLIPEAGALPWVAVVSVIGLGMGRLRRKS
jgi:hypothetical protein